jgi:hypothetical protein
MPPADSTGQAERRNPLGRKQRNREPGEEEAEPGNPELGTWNSPSEFLLSGFRLFLTGSAFCFPGSAVVLFRVPGSAFS